MAAGAKIWGWDATNRVWVPLQVDANGKLKISDVDPFTIAQATPENLKHVPYGYYAAGPSYLPFKVGSDGILQVNIASLAHLNDITDVSVPSPTDGYVLYWDAATSLWKAKAVSGSKIVDADGDTKVDTEASADEDMVRMNVAGVEAFLLDAAGVLTLAKQSYVSTYGNANQSIPNNTWTILNINTIVMDTQGEFNTTTHRYTAQKAGLYLVRGLGMTNYNSVDGQMINAAVHKNGSIVFQCPVFAPVASKAIGCSVVGISPLAVNDYIDLRAYQDSGAAQTWLGQSDAMQLVVFKIA